MHGLKLSAIFRLSLQNAWEAARSRSATAPLNVDNMELLRQLLIRCLNEKCSLTIRLQIRLLVQFLQKLLAKPLLKFTCKAACKTSSLTSCT